MERIWFNVVDAPWRAYPTVALALFGFVMLGRGLWFGSASAPGLLRQGRDAAAWIRGFQIAVVGLALVGIAAAWTWRQPWLLVVALGIAGEELLETSRILTALKLSPSERPAHRIVRPWSPPQTGPREEPGGRSLAGGRGCAGCGCFRLIDDIGGRTLGSMMILRRPPPRPSWRSLPCRRLGGR